MRSPVIEPIGDQVIVRRFSLQRVGCLRAQSLGWVIDQIGRFDWLVLAGRRDEGRLIRRTGRAKNGSQKNCPEYLDMLGDSSVVNRTLR